MADRYQQLGASASKQGLHQVLEASGLAPDETLFAALIPDLAGDPNYFSFIHCDGAGTKAIVPYLIYREQGDPSVFASLAQDALAMNLDDIFAVGLPERIVLANTIARNASVVGDDAVGAIVRGYQQLAERLAGLGVPVILGGGETADCGDIVRTLVVDAVVSGRIGASDVIRTSSIRAGDVVIGLASAGQASYEERPTSGIGSNGLTLARHALLSADYPRRYPEVVNPLLNPALVYRGPYALGDAPAGLGMTIGEALASPTRMFAPILAALYRRAREQVHGVIHLTGGGHTKVLRFARGLRIVKDTLLPVPPVFKEIQHHGNIPWSEMYQVFNVGCRMEIFAPLEASKTIIEIASGFGVDAQVVGRVEAHPRGARAAEVLLQTPYGELSYTL